VKRRMKGGLLLVEQKRPERGKRVIGEGILGSPEKQRKRWEAGRLWRGCDGRDAGGRRGDLQYRKDYT